MNGQDYLAPFMTPFTPEVRSRLATRLRTLYGDDFDADAFLLRLNPGAAEAMQTREAGWSERDVVLITYGDSIRTADGAEPPLRTLSQTLRTRLAGLFSDVHLLPCFPFTSDDGFSVSDYRTIDPKLGDWGDVEELSEVCTVAFDLVINHCSASHDWFAKCVAGEQPYRDYFISVDPSTDLSQVTRPRSLPLLTPVETAEGVRHFWTTFSPDQLDLNVGNPDVLREMLEVLLLYIARGGRIIRLDAIAFLWKQIGTTCLHLPQTHEVVKLMRDLVDAVAPHAILLTETNVPHAENVSYFGDGDEAHMVYQFSLAPLLLDAYVHEDATYLARWLESLERPPEGCTYFNFTASHDGIGVRPMEGLAPPERLDGLIARVRDNGGHVSTRTKPDGSESPYELNITWWSALQVEDPERSLRRFLSSQMVQVSLQGIPGVYVHSLFGTPNWTEGVAETGRARTINRRPLTTDAIARWTDDDPIRHRVLTGMGQILRFRRGHRAFDPESPQRVVSTNDQTLQIVRGGGGFGDPIELAVNLTSLPQRIDWVKGTAFTELPPFAAVWRTADGTLHGPMADDAQSSAANSPAS